jgi:predicted RecA/RadA family phage recombinase
MAVNDANIRAEYLQFAMPNNAAIVSGAPVLVGTLACVCEESYTPPTGTPTGMVSVGLIGAFFLTVTAATALSPLTGSAVKPGDRIYYDGGTTDSTTNVTYSGTLDKNSSATLFGTALDALTSGTTGTIRVRLKVA